MKKNILFYYHNFGGLGHGNRISLIIGNIIKYFGDEYNIIVINSGEKQDFLFPNSKNLKIINLPNYKFENYKLTQNEYNKKIKIYRKNIFDKLLNITKIESLVIEHYPFGRNFLDDEFIYLIREYKKNNDRGNVFSSVRDVFDIDSIQEKNLELFDRFLIHSDEKIINYNDKFHKNISKKIIYTGFIVNDIFKDTKSENNHILISIGGGQDGMEFVVDFLEKLNNTSFDGKVFVNLGKNYTQDNMEKIKSISNNKLEIKSYFDNFLELKIQSKLVVTMGGYNNLYENIYYKKTTIIYPRKSDIEQQTRLDILSKNLDYIYNGNKINSKELSNIFIIPNSPALQNRGISEGQGEVNQGLNFSGAYFSASFITNYKKYKYIKIRLTNACNATCDMCGVIKRKRKYNNVINLKQSILDFYKLGGEVVNFTGGEPTIYNGFVELLEFTKNLGLITSVSTNGSTLGKLEIKLIDFIDISIDGLYELHDKIRGIKGLFNTIDENISKLKEHGINVHINFTIRNDNISSVKEFFDFFKAKKVDSISFSMISTSPINNTKNLFPNKVQLKKFYDIDKKYILKNKYNIKIDFSPDFNGGHFDKFMDFIVKNNSFEKIKGNNCSFIKSKKEIRINENGNISPCCILDDYDENIGNIYKNNLIDIICNKEYENFLNKKFPYISKACLNCKIEI
ncbi:MAG: radical SAM protein [Candidatus Gracilibacteria bacterium]|nr:radical SAM protein [Candidatus Gracilibacteria bacterium]